MPHLHKALFVEPQKITIYYSNSKIVNFRTVYSNNMFNGKRTDFRLVEFDII
jgi:hypothetical protein